MRQAKPVVVGYHRIEIRGVEITPFMTHTREQAITKAKQDLSLTGIKSKFRPVYKKEAS